MKLNGYAPKFSMEYLKKLPIGEQEKTSFSHSEKNLLNGGGEGSLPFINSPISNNYQYSSLPHYRTALHPLIVL